ncbi:hypothetical protein [Sphingomicrobium sediminis]|uniref:Uncharacterized protein n=1 Tax=Sphingomicrobium sediminis TaxID=2950949 RepID=A0A9X2EMC2_9SPHN|nr:hypothetical protein [Sphingomicrobium sediminis]MCM8557942.1 hypothetical protein [Sphingomicrobium sediminis]
MILAALLMLADPATALDAELAFAADARENGQWQAFGNWAHEDGILIGRNVIPAIGFAAAAAENGEPHYATAWWPSLSVGSCDGRTAFNMGPFFSPGSGASGNFHTVWTLTEDGWRYLIDMGLPTADAEMADDPKIDIASCANLPQDVSPVEWESETARGATGYSDDGSLKWEWRHGIWGEDETPRRSLRTWRWDGEIYILVYEAEEMID